MMREGCTNLNFAFVAVEILWLVLGGAAALVARARRRRR